MTTPKQSRKTPAKKPAEAKVEKQEPAKIIRAYLVPILLLREPLEKDIPVGDLYYHKSSNSFELHCHRPNVEAELEMNIRGDISITTAGSVQCVSKAESPVTWITSLHKSNEFSEHPFIAQEAQEIYEA